MEASIDPRPILITGGSGFIGQHLCSLLSQKKQKVRVIDLVVPKDRIPGVEYVIGDIRKTMDVEQSIGGVQSVIHLAALVSVGICNEKPIESYQTNILGTCRVLDSIKKEMLIQNNSIPFIFSSSSAVYGDIAKSDEAVAESVPLGSPLSLYAAQKLAAEHMLKLYNSQFRIPTLALRLFNVFGNGQDPNSPYSGVISKFIQAAKNRHSLSLDGGGIATRDFVFATDVAEAFVKTTKLPVNDLNGQAINIGSGMSISIRDLAEKIIRLSGESNTDQFFNHTPTRKGDVPYSCANIEQASSVLKWSPLISTDEGLSNLILK